MAGAAPSSAQDADYYTGHDALKRVPIYDISYPLERGIVTDWSLYEKVLFDSFFKCAAHSQKESVRDPGCLWACAANRT